MSRRLALIALVAAVALAAAGVAIAHGIGAPAKTDVVSADIINATRQTTRERTCTGADGSYRFAYDLFKGPVSNSPGGRLDGDGYLRLMSRVNTATGNGTAYGDLFIRGTSGDVKARARIFAAVTGKTTLSGALIGGVPGQGKLIGTFTATLSSDWTSLSGKIGKDATSAAVIQTGSCPDQQNGQENGNKG